MSIDLLEKRKKVICDLMEDEFYVPMKAKELASFLQVPKEEKENFHKLLDELVAEGHIEKISVTCGI